MPRGCSRAVGASQAGGGCRSSRGTVLGISTCVGSSLLPRLPNPVMRPPCALLSLWALPCVHPGKEEGHTDEESKRRAAVYEKKMCGRKESQVPEARGRGERGSWNLGECEDEHRLAGVRAGRSQRLPVLQRGWEGSVLGPLPACRGAKFPCSPRTLSV